MVTLTDNDVTKLREHRYTLTELIDGFGIDIWDNERPFPIFDEKYRPTLQSRIEDHFAYRRIATSTPQMFVFMLNRRMRENMPAFNEIYKKLAKDDFDPFLTSEGTSSGTSKGKTDNGATTDNTSNTTSDGTNITSNTPASFLENAADPKYMSALVQSKSDSDATSSVKANSTTDSMSEHTDKYAGRTGYLATAVNATLASGFLNTDLLVCDMLEPLFMQFWDDQPL